MLRTVRGAMRALSSAPRFFLLIATQERELRVYDGHNGDASEGR
jgi:hypothetical protein